MLQPKSNPRSPLQTLKLLKPNLRPLPRSRQRYNPRVPNRNQWRNLRRPTQRLLRSPKISPLWSNQKQNPRPRNRQRRIPVHHQRARNRLTVGASLLTHCHLTDHLEIILSTNTTTLLALGIISHIPILSRTEISTVPTFCICDPILPTTLLSSMDRLASPFTTTSTQTSSGDTLPLVQRLA